MQVIQRFKYKDITIEWSRFPNGNGCLISAKRWLDDYDIFREISVHLSEEDKLEVRKLAAKEWDNYWTQDPRCAQSWVEWHEKQEAKGHE